MLREDVATNGLYADAFGREVGSHTHEFFFLLLEDHKRVVLELEETSPLALRHSYNVGVELNNEVGEEIKLVVNELFRELIHSARLHVVDAV